MREVTGDAVRVVADPSAAADSSDQLNGEQLNPPASVTRGATRPSEEPTLLPLDDHEQPAPAEPTTFAKRTLTPRTPTHDSRETADDLLDIDLPIDEPASHEPLDIDLPVDFSAPRGEAAASPQHAAPSTGPASLAAVPPAGGFSAPGLASEEPTGAELTSVEPTSPELTGAELTGAGPSSAEAAAPEPVRPEPATPGPATPEPAATGLSTGLSTLGASTTGTWSTTGSAWDTRDHDTQPSWNRPSGVSPITRSERRAAEAAAANRAIGIEQVHSPRGQFLWALVRFAFAAAFLWTFFDKLLGLNAPTPPAEAWRAGGSPAGAHLAAADGPLAGLFTSLAERAWVDWLFMIGLAVVGLALLLGVGLVIATAGAVLILLTSWLADLPVPGNPVLDPRVLAALVLVCLVVSGAGLRYSLAPWWRRTSVVQKVRLLR